MNINVILRVCLLIALVTLCSTGHVGCVVVYYVVEGVVTPLISGTEMAQLKYDLDQVSRRYSQNMSHMIPMTIY